MKANCVIIKFEPKWILSNLVSGKSLIMDDVLKVIREQYIDNVVIIVQQEFHLCKLIIAANEVLNVNELSLILKANIDTISNTDFSVAIEEVAIDKLGEVLASAEQELSEKEKEFFKKEFNVCFSGNDDITEEVETESVQTAPPIEASDDNNEILKIDNLIGMDNLRRWAAEIEKVAKSFSEITIKTNVIKNIAYLISINRGNGLSTVLEIMAETLENSGLVDFSGRTRFIEFKLEYSDNPNDFEMFETLYRKISNCRSTRFGFKGIVSIDVEDWLDHLTDKRFDQLLKYVWDNREDIIFVFTVPFVDNIVLEKLYDRIDDVISTRIMKFAPPSDEQYFAFLGKIFAQYEIELEKDAYNAFVTKITMEKNDGKFYGFNTIRKIANEILYGIIAEAAKSGTELPRKVTSGEFNRIYQLEESDGLSGLEQLQGMVALKDVKDKVREIMSTVKFQKELHAKDNTQIKPCFHMMFTGNPGTGKTVVARLIGRIFKEEGLLSVGNFYEVSRKDFIGRFVGHTAPKTMEICRNAYGSVLFIDEAYMLAEDQDGFSSEAIGTLIAEMENNRDKMVVIFAGYAKELEELFDMNPGLRDRIPHKIDFPNYNRDELKQIFFMQIDGKVKFDESFVKKADEFFAEFPDSVLSARDFSNGRFVRNLAERIMSKAALRFEMSNVNIDDFALTATDFNVAVSDTDFQKLFHKVKRVKTIGF